MSKEAEKFIEKYTTKDQNDWLVEKKDIIARFMESYHTEQLTLTDVGGMFSEEKMEQAWTDGAGCGESRSGYFDIENYR